MNLLEHYIEEIHSVQKIERKWGVVILADLTVNCYGVISRTTTTFGSVNEWERIKKQGYYMA